MRLHEDESSLPPHSPGCLSFLSEVLSLIDLAVADAGGARGDETGVMEASAGGVMGLKGADERHAIKQSLHRQQRAVV